MPISIKPFIVFWQNLLKAKPEQQAFAMLMFMATLLLVILLFTKLDVSLKWFLLIPLVALTSLAGLAVLQRIWRNDATAAGGAIATATAPEETNVPLASSERMIVGKLRKLELGENTRAPTNRYISKPVRVSQARLLTLFDRMSPS